MSKKLRIFIADDHAVLREGLSMLINSLPDMEVIGNASNGQEACQLVHLEQPDVVVMDLAMPKMDGYQATCAIKQVDPHVKIIILSVNEDMDYLRLLMNAGASGYITKNTMFDELVIAIRRAADGGIYVDSSLTQQLVKTKPQGSAPFEEREVVLSDREVEVMHLIAWGYTTAEIAERLCLSSRTVETYRARSMEKLRLQNRVDIVRYAARRGWFRNF